MPQTKTFQHLRNSTVYNNLAAAQSALQDSTFMSNRSDGEMIFARYNKTEDNATVVKTLAGLYHKNGNNVSCTFLMEVNPDDDHMTVSVNDMVYWDYKQDKLVSGTSIKTINETSILGAGDIDTIELIFGYMGTTTGESEEDFLVVVETAGGMTGTFPVSIRDEKHLYIDTQANKAYRYNTTTTSFVEIGGGPSITVDSTITSGGTNPVRGGTIYTALQGKIGYISYQDLSSLDGDTPANGTIGFDEDNANFYIYNGIEGEWFRIDRLVVNSITNGSLNAVTSGAVYTALSNKEDKVTVVTVSTSGAVSQALDPNKFYKFTGDLTSLSLTFNSGTELAVYAGKFNTDSTGCTLTVPGTIHEAVGNPTLEGSKTYEFNVADNVLIMIEV